MSRKPSALKVFKEHKRRLVKHLPIELNKDYFLEDLDIIELELKKPNASEMYEIDLEQENKALWRENEKLKQVFNIIKINDVDVFLIKESSNVDSYNKHFEYSDVIYSSRSLTEEEFSILKKWLKE